MKTALLIVDVQMDYFPEGKNPLYQSESACEQTRTLLEQFRAAQKPVIFIQHISTRPGAKFFLPGTPGSEIHPRIAPLPGETVIPKNYPNSFRETSLLDVLKSQEITGLVICGMMTHMCIDTTVRAAFDLGFTNWIAGDACATKDLVYQGNSIPASQVHAAFLAALNGMFGQVLGTEQIISDVLPTL